MRVTAVSDAAGAPVRCYCVGEKWQSVFIRQGQGKSASGKPLPVITTHVRTATVTALPWQIAELTRRNCQLVAYPRTREERKHRGERKRRTKKQKKEPETKQGDYRWVRMKTCWYLIAPMLIGVTRTGSENAVGTPATRRCVILAQLAEGRADLYTEMPVKVSGLNSR